MCGVGSSSLCNPRIAAISFVPKLNIFLHFIYSAKKEAALKKPDPKPKVVSLFDDDGAEEEDWFDNINPEKPKP